VGADASFSCAITILTFKDTCDGWMAMMMLHSFETLGERNIFFLYQLTLLLTDLFFGN
jgi:hypothetical protein